jgi:uncharacterized membrane protein
VFPFRKKEFFNKEQKEKLVEAIKEAEKLTSGEIRLYVESHCRFVHSLDRAVEVFASLKMHETHQRNAVLIYVALKDQQYAIYGDSGIHEKVGDDFWKQAAKKLVGHFKDGKIVEGLCACIHEIGLSLQEHFPHKKDDENELPDDIIFGK